MADHSGLGSCSALTLAAGFRALSIARCDKRLLELHLLIVSHSGAAPQGHIFYGGIMEGWSLGRCLRSCVHQ
ncbi:putative sugar kinase [Bradyrhizobium sp. GM5.1]